MLGARSALSMDTGLMNAKENASISIAHHAHLSSRKDWSSGKKPHVSQHGKLQSVCIVIIGLCISVWGWILCHFCIIYSLDRFCRGHWSEQDRLQAVNAESSYQPQLLEVTWGLDIIYLSNASKLMLAVYYNFGYDLGWCSSCELMFIFCF